MSWLNYYLKKFLKYLAYKIVYDPLKGLKNYMGQLIFDEESIYEISKPKLKFVTDRHTDGQAQSNMPLFQSWGHKNQRMSRYFYRCRYCIVLICATAITFGLHIQFNCK